MMKRIAPVFIPVSLLFPFCAAAQTTLEESPEAATEQTAQPTPEAQGKVKLEEILVTATKRAESLQDVSVSVTAMSAADLQRHGITNVSRLDVMVPGLSVGQGGPSVRPNMRGARTEQVEHNDPAIAFYSNGVYRPRHAQAMAGFIDVERVETLRGPQGTLFGRNSLGGAINIVSKKPSMEGMDFGISTTAGDYKLLKTEGFVNVPLGDRAAVRISANRETRDPYVENTFLGGDSGFKDADNKYIRGQLLVEPTEDWSILLRGERWEDNSNGFGSFGFFVEGIPIDPETGLTDGTSDTLIPRIGRAGEDCGTPGRVGAGCDFNGPGAPGLGTAQGTESDEYTVRQDFEPSLNILMKTFGGEINYYGFDFADVKLVVNDTDWDERRRDDADLSVFDSVRMGNIITSESGMQELQLTSKGDSRLEWVAGVFFHQEDLTDAFIWQQRNGVFGANLVDNAPSDAGTAPPQAFNPDRPTADSFNPLWAPWQDQIDIETRSKAVYASATYSVTETIRIEGGARFTDDEREWDILGQNSDNLEQIDFQPKEGLQNIEQDWQEPTWKVGVEWDAMPNAMAYANASTGFLAGNAEGQASDERFYDEQTVTAYEAGFKSTWQDGAVRLNVALYYNDYEDLLTQNFIEEGATIISQQVNGGAIEAKGAEFELDWQATPALNLGLRANLSDAEYGDFQASNLFETGGNLELPDGGNAFQLDGLQVQMSPDATATLFGSYDFDLGQYGILRPGVTFFWSDDYRTSDTPVQFGNQDSYTKTDATISWLSRDGIWEIKAFVHNIEDDAIKQRATRFGGNIGVSNFKPPRTFGATVSYNY